jgi:TPR repeat protein
MDMKLEGIIEAANLGNVAAQVVVAISYWNGCGVEADMDRALQFARRAAESGDAFAQYCLGLLLEAVSSDSEKRKRGETLQFPSGPHQSPVIFSWYRRSADQGFPPAQLAVSGCYQFGWGVTADLAAARGWAQKAATAGYAPAQEVLSHIYSEGIGGRIDKAAAFHWALAAAEHGHAGGAYLVASAYEAGEGVERDEAAALQWYRKSAEAGYWLAHSTLTQIYRLGLLGLEQDESKASEHQRMAERLQREALPEAK